MSLLVAAALLLGLVLLVLFLKNRQDDATHLGGMHPNRSAGVRESPEALIQDGRMLDAIKAVRERHRGLGLKDAKDMADHFREHGSWPAVPAAAPTSTPTPAPAPARGPAAFAPTEDLQSLIRDGHLIQAIKRVREQHPGMDLREAKELVETLAARLR
jgi:ribosomal protein L7/L12